MVSTEKLVVLNVDDYEAGRYATSRVLRQAGFEVMEAASGQEALRLAREQPDLVVLDVNLPDVDGFEVCRRIKGESDTATIPVLYLSAAYRGPEHRVQGLDMGADAYLTQPVDPRELVATVNALLRARHVRDAVRESEERFRSLMTATTDIIWTTGPEGVFTLPQGDWQEFTGQGWTEARGWGWLEAVHPEDRERVAGHWRQALAARVAFAEELRLRRADGEYRHMTVRAVPVLEADGRVREWVGAHTDVTERKESERALRERNTRLHLLSDAANRLLATDNPQEYVSHLYRRLAAFLGLEVYFNYLRAEDGEGLVLASYGGVPEEAAASVRRIALGETICGSVAETEEEVVVDAVQESDDPRLALVRSLGVSAFACFPLLSHGRLIGTLSFGTRTRPSFAAGELSLMGTVCDQVAVAMERARLIAELQERARALEEANRAKSDFLATMSHELRTPLNAMIGYTDLLLIGVPAAIPDEAKLHVDRIRGAAVHLTQLIEEVLTHAQFEAGRDALHLESVPLPSLLAEVAALIEPLAQKKGLRFTAAYDQLPAQVVTDPRNLRQILLNLLGNAVKFTERGEVALRARPEGGRLLLEVRDTGIGIPAEHLERIFEPFWQVDGSRTRLVGGTGLGLGVVRQLAQRLGGDVRVESEVGRGSRFVVTLPLEGPAA
jgi:PAS domain S-box-containing protein